MDVDFRLLDSLMLAHFDKTPVDVRRVDENQIRQTVVAIEEAVSRLLASA